MDCVEGCARQMDKHVPEPDVHDTQSPIAVAKRVARPADVCSTCGKQIKYIAAELEMAPAELSQILAGTDGRRFPVEKLPTFIRVTAPKGHLIIFWLIDHFLSDEETRKGRALAAVEALLPDLMRAVEELKK
jgi:hypothetical protein